LVFICLVALVATSADGASSQDFESDVDRIIGGEYAKQGQFPYQISIRSGSVVWDADIQANVTKYFHFCGGSILTERWALSAAHCTEESPPSTLVIVVGAHKVFGDGVRYPVEAYIHHPEYDSWNLFNDLSLLKTRWAIQFNARVQPIAISRRHTEERASAIVSGWGVNQDGSQSNHLKFLKTNVLSKNDCVKRLDPERAARVTDNALCTFKSKNHGFCFGDSGGPLVHNHTLIGAVSWMVPCGKGKPDVFMRVSSYVDWIVNVTAVNVLN